MTQAHDDAPMTHQKIPDARDIDGEGLIIREGHRYQDRNGDVHGPIRPSGDRQYPWEDTLSSWTEAGRWIGGDDDSEFDLIAEALPPSPSAVEHVERGEEASRDREDAERWRALMSSARMHFMGCAGFAMKDGAPPTPRPGDVWHFGMEFWSEHTATSKDGFERRMITNYVDAIRARAKEIQP